MKEENYCLQSQIMRLYVIESCLLVVLVLKIIVFIILTLIFGILIHEHVEMVVAVPRSHFAFVRSPEKH